MKMKHFAWSWSVTAVVASMLLVGVGAAAAQVVGNVAAIEELVEVQRGGAWSALSLGDGVHAGDRLRSDGSGRLRLVLADGSVIVMVNDSQMTVDAHVFRGDAGGASSLLTLLKGKIRAIVSRYYRGGGSFDVQTPTAVSGVRGTDFIVLFDHVGRRTDVVGVSGRVAVRGVTATPATATVSARELTIVKTGENPRPPVALNEEQFRYYLNGLEFVGGGRPESLLFNQPLLLDDRVPVEDRAEALIESLDVDERRADGRRQPPGGDPPGGEAGLDVDERSGGGGGPGGLDVDERAGGREGGGEEPRDVLDVDERAPAVGWGAGFPWDEADLDVDEIPWERDPLGPDASGVGTEPGDALGDGDLGIRF